jgi:hypothetical protein
MYEAANIIIYASQSNLIFIMIYIWSKHFLVLKIYFPAVYKQISEIHIHIFESPNKPAVILFVKLK